MATEPPLKKGHMKLMLMGVGAVVVIGAILYIVHKMRSGKAAPSSSTMNTVNQATSGTPQVSAAAAGAAAASGTGPASVSTSVPDATSAASFSPVTAAPSVATSGATVVATSASTVAAPTVAASAPTASPLFVAYKNMSVVGPIKSGLCMDSGGPFDSAALYWCLGSNSQQWSVDPTSGNVKVNATGNCLASTDSAGASGSQVTTKPCSSSDASQLWDWVSGAFKLRGTNQCADSGVVGNGARFSMQPCNTGTPTQTWTN